MSSRCTDTGGTESECTEPSGRGGEGTAALEGNCKGPHPAAPRLCLPGVALLPEPGALLPYVSNETAQLKHDSLSFFGNYFSLACHKVIYLGADLTS